ncbi:MAG: hypothetical protein M1812_004058 [Candelaria pacifica]|nr:MAG: hypothetical protein M1812_004058 [Candelaria pacifica]
MYAEERAEVEVLDANLDKIKAITKKIQASMMRLETSGATVQQAIGPIYGNTQRLQIINSNIDRVNEAIDKLREPLDMKAREERIIRAGAQNVGLSEYLASLNRTRQAHSDLKFTNLRSNQRTVAELNGLLKSGIEQLEVVFRDTLKEHARPVEPLHFVTKQLSFPTIKQDHLSRLALINSFISSVAGLDSIYNRQETPTVQIYAEVRGNYISASLHNLAAASINTARKKASDAAYRQGTNAIGTYAAGLEGLSLAEHDNICSLFTREEWSHVYDSTCRGAVGEFSKTLQDLNTHIKSNLTTDCYLSYEIIDIVSNLSSRLHSQTGELKGLLADSLKPIRETARISLSELLEDTRRRIGSLQILPADGSSVPITAETITRLQMMTAYIRPLSSIMASLGDGNWSSPPSTSSSNSTPTLKAFDVGADGRQLFSHYATDTIEVLLSNLESKSRTLLRGKSLIGVFIANNVTVVERMIRSSDLLPLLSNSTVKIDTWRKKGTSLYVDAWHDTSRFLLDSIHTNRGARPPSGNSGANESAAIIKGLSGKEKDKIKENFKAFNISFDDLVDRHTKLAMEPEVRALLTREVQKVMQPLYDRFWDRYHEIDKGKGKYVKYDKGSLAAKFASLG